MQIGAVLSIIRMRVVKLNIKKRGKEMKTVLKYIYLGILMLLTLFLRLYLVIIKRIKTTEEYDKAVFKIVNGWAAYILKVIGVKVKLKGIENLPEGNCLFVSNHQGNIDFLLPMAYLNKQIGFIAKKEILKLRIVSMWMKEMHCVFIDRKNIRESLKAINQGAENLEKGYSMLIFPEGTRSRSHKLGEFKKGSMKMATKANAPVVPLVLDNTFKVFEEGKGWLKEAEVTLSVLKPIYIDKLSKEEKGDLSNIIRREIEEELNCIMNN